MVDRLDRPLRLGVVAAQRLDGVAEELDADRLRLAGREDVDQAAADAELAVLIDGIGAGEAGVDEAIGERRQVDVDVGLQHHGGVAHPLDAADAGGNRRHRGHDDACRLRRQRVQGARPRRRHVEVRRDLAIRIDLERRAGEHDALGVGGAPALERRGKEADVGDQRIDVAIGGHDDEHRRPARRGRQGERHRGRRDPGEVLRPGLEPGAFDRAEEQRAQRQRRRRGHGHQPPSVSCIRATMRDVE